jgi:hypothetical protein
MNRKLVGAILLSSAGFILAIGTVGAQVAYALVCAGFDAGQRSGLVPPSPIDAYPHGLIDIVSLVLGVIGLYFLFSPGGKDDHAA